MEEKKLQFKLPEIPQFERPKFGSGIKFPTQSPPKEEKKTSSAPYISTEGYEDDEDDAREDPEQHWYALQVDARKLKFIYEGIDRVMHYHCIELISLFDPHYKKEVKKSKDDIGYRKTFRGDQLYDGYFFICMKEYDMAEVENDLVQVNGVIRILGIFSEKEFDAMYQTFLKMSGVKSFAPAQKKVSITTGMNVMVKEGQYGSLKGKVVGFQKNQTLATLQLSIFGRELNVSVPIEFLEEAF
jgi:transcription antitermination factor NusG